MNKIVEEDLERILAYKLPWQMLRGQRVLVTGGTGFVGSWLAMTCARAGAKVAVTARDANEVPLADEMGLSVYECRGNVLLHALTDFCPAIIIHAASPGDPKQYLAKPVDCLDINILGTSQCLAYAIEHKPTVMLISSGEVYGEGCVMPAEEWMFGCIDPGHPRACYSEGKRAAEALCYAYGRQYSVPTRVVRLFHSYGPGMRPDDSRVVPAMLATVQLGRNPVVRSKAKRTFLYATDMVTGIMSVLLKGDNGEPYNVGSTCPHEVKVVGELLNNGIVDYAQELEGDSPHECLVPDITKMSSLGWYPMVDLVEGLKRMKESVQ